MILKGRYCIVDRLGQGGEGCIYLARDMELGVVWAVKEIPISRKKEAKLFRLLEHPYMPRMVDYLEKGDFCYLVMEYIRGKSLRQWMEEGRVFSVEEIVEFGIAISQVLGYLHTRKPPVYYGDLKPDNLILSQENKIFLVDFGSAVFGYSREQRQCTGTHGYAAPEQYKGQMSEASDVYAFGKTLQTLLGKRMRRTLLLNPAMAKGILKCCRMLPGHRYQDMKSVEEALKALQRKEAAVHMGMVKTGIMAAVLLVIAGGLLLGKGKKKDFYQALQAVTQMYYQTDFRDGDKEAREEICTKAQEKLHDMLKIYQEKEEQRRLFLLLAVNEEYAGKNDQAALYYEQLLLYDPEYGDGYGEYGLFLLRAGQEEESLCLWEDYEKKRNSLKENGSRNLQLWEERMSVYEKKMGSSLYSVPLCLSENKGHGERRL